MSPTTQRPEGALIKSRAKRARLSGREAAERTGISDARWRQIINGYQSMGGGQRAAVIAPPETLARMARTVGALPDELREVGRGDAADVLELLADEPASAPSAADRLSGLRDELSAIIAELRHAERADP